MALLDEILAVQPALCWPLTEASGTVATDVSGNERHGTWSNSTRSLATVLAHEPQTWLPGTSNIYTKRSYEAALNPGTGDFAISFFFKGTRPSNLSSDGNNWECLFQRDTSATGNGLDLYITGVNTNNGAYPPGNLRLWCGGSVLQSMTKDLHDNIQHFIWIERRSGTLYFYVDMALVASGGLSGSANGTNSEVLTGVAHTTGYTTTTSGYAARNPYTYLTYWVGTIPSLAQARRIMDAGFRKFGQNTLLLAQMLQDTPSGLWILDETSGTTAYDYSGNNRHGTYSGTYSQNYKMSPMINGADFGGGMVSWADAAWQSPHAGASGQMTLEAWIIPDTVTTINGMLFSKGASGAYEYDIRVVHPSNGEFSGHWHQASGAAGVMGTGAGTTQLIAGNLYHVAVTYNRATPYTASYVNGVLNASVSSANGTTSDTNSSLRLAGIREDGAGNIYDGKVGWAALYSTALSPARIKAHYEAGLRGGVVLG